MSVELSPENRVYVKLNNRFKQLNSPKLCLCLDSSDDLKPNKWNSDSIEMNCNSCQLMKRMVCIKDIAINRLTEDREELKLKLTEINNKNIELTQKLKRFETEKHDSNQCKQINDKYIDLKAKYDELEAINRHLRQHLNTLRHVFNELHNTSESTTNTTTNTSNTTTTTQSVDKTSVIETKSKSTSTELNSNTDKTINNITIDESLGQTLKSSFDKWYNK